MLRLGKLMLISNIRFLKKLGSFMDKIICKGHDLSQWPTVPWSGWGKRPRFGKGGLRYPLTMDQWSGDHGLGHVSMGVSNQW